MSCGAVMLDEGIEREQLAVEPDDEADALEVAGQRPVVGVDRRREPALVDAAAALPEREVVVRVELDPASRRAERAGNPGRGEADDAAARVERTVHVSEVGGDRGFPGGGHAGSHFLPRMTLRWPVPETRVTTGRRRLDSAFRRRGVAGERLRAGLAMSMAH